MSREKQIEEMTKITCLSFRRESDKNCCGIDYCDMKCLHYQRCEALYNAGYRKQSEGEWIDVEDTLLYRYKCSLCGEIKLGKMTNFCPNCGAKMKGGAE